MAKVTLALLGTHWELEAPGKDWKEVVDYIYYNWQNYDLLLLRLLQMLLDDGSIVESSFDLPEVK
jgi:hypothetical protein